MAKGDIMPYQGRDEGSVLPPIRSFRLNAAETFVQGEPVRLNVDGELAEAGDDPGVDDFIGISAESGDTVGATDAIGRFRDPRYQFTPGANPDLPATGDMIRVWLPVPGSTFVAKYFATDGAGTQAAPALSNIGDEAGLTLAGGIYSVDVGTANNICRIVDIIDGTSGDSLQATGGTPTTTSRIIIEFVTSQNTDATAPAA